jgi:hypothetical protein
MPACETLSHSEITTVKSRIFRKLMMMTLNEKLIEAISIAHRLVRNALTLKYTLSRQ